MKEKEEEGCVNMCEAYDELIKDEVMEATRKNTIEVTKQVTEQVTKQVTKQVSRETKMTVLQANIHAMVEAGASEVFIRKVALMTFPDMADCIEKQILKERQLMS